MMGVKSCMLVYLLICTVRLTSACTSGCQKKLVETCPNLKNDQLAPTLCADNIYTMVDTLMRRAKRMSESTETLVESHHVIIKNKISTVCNSSRDTCKDFDVIGYTAINVKDPLSEPIKMSLLPVSKSCSNNPWGFYLALEVHVKMKEIYDEWIFGRCAWGSSDTSDLSRALQWTSQTEQTTTVTKPPVTSIPGSHVTSHTTTSVSSSSVTSPAVTLSNDGKTNPTVAAKATDGVTGPSVAAIACSAFIMGILSSLCVLSILSMKRQNKLCFKVVEEPSPGKWEGASKPVTTKVIAKHLKNKTKKDQYEEIKKKASKTAVTSDQPYDNTLDHHRDSHVYSALTENQTDRNEANVEKKENSTSHVYLDLSQHNLYESGRESSDSYFPNAAFRNSNFAADENDTEAGEEKRDKYVNARVRFSNHKHSPTDGSVTQEEEHVGGGPQQTKGDTKENTSNSETASTNNHESAYFILEKGSSEPKEPKEDHTYFKLEVR